MSWCAGTSQDRIGPRTVLSFFERSWGPDIPVRPLPFGISVTVRFPNGATTKVDVIDATATEAIVQTLDQTKWRMVRTAAKDLGYPPADTAGAPATYWVINEHIGATALPCPHRR
jgi:hypothetical protein